MAYKGIKMKIYYDNNGFIVPEGVELDSFLEVDKLPEVDSSIGEYLFVENGSVVIKICKDSLINKQIADAKYLLDSTQYKFGDDYDLKDTPEWLELKAKRQKAREFIRNNNA